MLRKKYLAQKGNSYTNTASLNNSSSARLNKIKRSKNTVKNVSTTNSSDYTTEQSVTTVGCTKEHIPNSSLTKCNIVQNVIIQTQSERISNLKYKCI
jgi:hypothetical protein